MTPGQKYTINSKAQEHLLNGIWELVLPPLGFHG